MTERGEIKLLAFAALDVAFIRSPRYLAERIADAVDARMRDVRDERHFWRGVQRAFELRPSELPELQARVASKYCRNLDIWQALPGLRGRYRTLLVFSGPQTVLECWRQAYPIDRTFDMVVRAGDDALTARDEALYRTIATRESVEPAACALVDATADGVDAAIDGGLHAYRYGTAYGLLRWLEGGAP
jgi:FMN phosphatase YigB (HAD superfamily)